MEMENLATSIAGEVISDLFEGGAGSGNWGHKGRPGMRGGSLGGGGKGGGISAHKVSGGAGAGKITGNKGAVIGKGGSAEAWKVKTGEFVTVTGAGGKTVFSGHVDATGKGADRVQLGGVSLGSRQGAQGVTIRKTDNVSVVRQQGTPGFNVHKALGVRGEPVAGAGAKLSTGPSPLMKSPGSPVSYRNAQSSLKTGVAVRVTDKDGKKIAGIISDKIVRKGEIAVMIRQHPGERGGTPWKIKPDAKIEIVSGGISAHKVSGGGPPGGSRVSMYKDTSVGSDGVTLKRGARMWADGALRKAQGDKKLAMTLLNKSLKSMLPGSFKHAEITRAKEML